jgi:hypothetical protein
MADLDSPTWPTQLQIFDAGTGVLQTVYGWFPVTNFTATLHGLSFDVDRQNEVPPNTLDVRIIERASQILSDPRAWNRQDNRKCSKGARTFSIYCAGEQAVADITRGIGLLDHRRPALEVIRAIVDDRSQGRNYNHRLMDYNNDPTTTFDDVQSLFREALYRVHDKAWLQRHGFAAASWS